MPDDMKAVVERVEAAATIANGFGGTTASVSLTDLRALLSERRKMVEALEEAEREVDFAYSGTRNLAHDFAELETLWPASRRGSRAERAYRDVKDRAEAIALCVRDARAALTGSREQEADHAR